MVKIGGKWGQCNFVAIGTFVREGKVTLTRFTIWCKNAAGRTVSSHSTTYHARFIDTPRTYILEKPAGAALTIDIERRNGRAVVTDVR